MFHFPTDAAHSFFRNYTPYRLMPNMADTAVYIKLFHCVVGQIDFILGLSLTLLLWVAKLKHSNDYAVGDVAV